MGTLLDPMCGTGMLLTESPRGAYVIGVDSNPDMLQRAAAHFESLGRQRWDLLLADASKLPLPDDVADVAVCDFPFGRQFGCVERNKVLYPAVLSELRRLVRRGG